MYNEDDETIHLQLSRKTIIGLMREVRKKIAVDLDNKYFKNAVNKGVIRFKKGEYLIKVDGKYHISNDWELPRHVRDDLRSRMAELRTLHSELDIYQQLISNKQTTLDGICIYTYLGEDIGDVDVELSLTTSELEQDEAIRAQRYKTEWDNKDFYASKKPNYHMMSVFKNNGMTDSVEAYMRGSSLDSDVIGDIITKWLVKKSKKLIVQKMDLCKRNATM